MQKTTEGLGIMIIEGSHKAFGKGIFVSDIQQNSLAFKVGIGSTFKNTNMIFQKKKILLDFFKITDKNCTNYL